MRVFLRRQRYLLEYSLASLARHPGKYVLLLLVYSLLVFLLASVLLFSQALHRETELLLADAPEILVQRLLAGRPVPVPAAYLERLQGIRGIREPSGRLWGLFYDPIVRANYTMLVPQTPEIPAGEIQIGRGIARSRGLEVGDYLSLRNASGATQAWRVAALLDGEAELVNQDLILMNTADFRQFFGYPEGRFTDLVLRVPNEREQATIAEKIVRILPDTRPILRSELLRTYSALFSWRQGLIFLILLGGLLAFVILAWDRASGLSSEERREIGLLKALGWETSDLLRMKFWEGAVLSLSAFLLGDLLAYAHVFFFGAGLFAPVLQGWAVLYPQFHPKPFIDGFQIATLFFFTVFPYTVATIVPIWRAAIADPDEIMR